MEANLIQEQWDEEISLIKQRIVKLSNRQDLIAFYGSSSIRLWTSMQEDLYPLNSLNLGFGGSTYKDCLYYFSEVFDSLSPRTIILYGGDNDIANGETPMAIQRYFQAIVEKIQQKYPTKALAVMSIKPSPSRAGYLDQIAQTNKLLRHYIQTVGGTYIDIYSAMLDENLQPKAELFLEDALHLNALGYKLWTTVLKKHLM